MLSEFADVLAAGEAESVDTTATADSRGGAGPEVAMAALTAAVHLLQWDQHVVSTAGENMEKGKWHSRSLCRWYNSSPGRFGGKPRLRSTDEKNTAPGWDTTVATFCFPLHLVAGQTVFRVHGA